jgi:hypothetical protein
MDVYLAQKAIYVMEEQIRTNQYQLSITMEKFVRKDFIVLKVLQILHHVHLELSTPSKVWALYNNARCAK